MFYRKEEQSPTAMFLPYLEKAPYPSALTISQGNITVVLPDLLPHGSQDAF